MDGRRRSKKMKEEIKNNTGIRLLLTKRGRKRDRRSQMSLTRRKFKLTSVGIFRSKQLLVGERESKKEKE